MPSKKDKRKAHRKLIYNKTNGRCGYCGTALKKTWHIDHINPIYRTRTDASLKRDGITRGTESNDNKIASCVRCNRWKSTMSVDLFRKQIESQHDRLYRDSPGYRLAFDMGLIKFDHSKPVFYFEGVSHE